MYIYISDNIIYMPYIYICIFICHLDIYLCHMYIYAIYVLPDDMSETRSVLCVSFEGNLACARNGFTGQWLTGSFAF